IEAGVLVVLRRGLLAFLDFVGIARILVLRGILGRSLLCVGGAAHGRGLGDAIEGSRVAPGSVGTQEVRRRIEIESPRLGKSTALSRALHLPAFTDIPGEFPLALGGSLRGVRIRWEEWGRRAGDGANTIMVFPALSAHSHLRSHADDPSEGWWDAM